MNDRFVEELEGAGSDPDPNSARLELAQRYSYVLPDSSALKTLADLSPLVETGAGTGYWAYRLQLLGADVLAFDQAPPDAAEPNRYHPPAQTWTAVLAGDQTALAAHGDRALFLCWPPLFSSLGDVLQFYSGDTVACIGDGGQRTARIAGLNDEFTLTLCMPVSALDPAPDAAPTLSIWRRLV